MARNINNNPFTEETLLKLDIFRNSFREWLPVFIHQLFWKKLYVYDFFAGSGYDSEGNPGSPIILLDEAKGKDQMNCNSLKDKSKEIVFVFNEHEPQKKRQDKYELLKSNTKSYLIKCSKEHHCNECTLNLHHGNFDFSKEFKSNKNIKAILDNHNYAKFIIMDQYGFTQVDADIFSILINSPHTDFIFFISSSFLSRFRELIITKKFLGEKKLDFDENEPKKCHQVIVKYFESLIPTDKEYYLNHFTIKKGSNYYGLIFGTAHTLGMEKFQKVCWQEDSKAGESNCNTQNDFGDDTLFGNLEPNKIQQVKDILKKDILSGKIKSNIDGLKEALRLRCEPKVFTEEIKELEKNNKIERVGVSKSYKSTNIHQIKEDGKDYYAIRILR